MAYQFGNSKPGPKKDTFRERGLWAPAVRIDIQDVTRRHKSDCVECGQRPTGRRLQVQVGKGKGLTSIVYCQDCGYRWLEDRQEELDRAMDRLNGMDVTVRLPRDAK
jgi:tRNA(Ile2) C34 agmatinyltransferase TiaS